MTNVLLVGAFGQGNPGDEALCAAFVRALAGDDVVVASSDPAGTADRHGVRAIADRLAASPASCATATPSSSAVAPCSRRCARRPGVGRPRCCATPACSRLRRRRDRQQVAFVGVGAGDLRGQASLVRWPAGSSATPTCSSCATRSRRRR